MFKNENYMKIQEPSNLLANKIGSFNETGIIEFTNDQNLIFNILIFKKLSNFENCVCKLKIPKNNDSLGYATGFFCYIP